MSPIGEADLILNPDGSVYHLSLKPADIADTIITVGDPNRVNQVSKHFERIEFEMNKREFITHTGYFRKKRLTVISSGIGTDNVEILLTELDALVNIDLATRTPRPQKKKLNIIRIGTSGALQEDISTGSYLVSEYAIGLDNLMTFYELPQTDFETAIGHGIGEAVGLPFTPYVVKGSETLLKKIGDGMRRGNTVTCPGFYAPQGRGGRLKPRFSNLLRDLMAFHDQKTQFWLTNFEMETAGYYALGQLLGHEILSVNAIVVNRPKNRFSSDPDAEIEGLIKKVLALI